ncbi:helix-turn-helix domain-containing protein [Actinomadura chibensis]|nr:AraC family transcriptional regulator [Actinomadura chibensis]
MTTGATTGAATGLMAGTGTAACALDDATPVRAAQRDGVGRVIEFLRRNPAVPISTGEMARMANFSACYFHQVFRSVTGVSPGSFHAALRMESAKRLLLDEGRRVTDVCFEVGYSSPGTFSSRFREMVGVSPREFRRLAGLRAPVPAPPVAATPVPATPVRPHPTSRYRRLHLPVVIGFYDRPVPQGRPRACALAYRSPVEEVPRLRDGLYYVFGASFAWSDDDARSYLLLESHRDDLLVGSPGTPLTVRDGRVRQPVRLRLRPPRATDPPLLSVFSHPVHHFEGRGP